MTTIKESAKAFQPKQGVVCIECNKQLKDYRSIRCRSCFNTFFQINPNTISIGSKNAKWKENPGYRALHYYIRRNKPFIETCEFCNVNLSEYIACVGDYTRDLSQWKWSCAKCHVYTDGTINNLIHNNRRKNQHGK